MKAEYTKDNTTPFTVAEMTGLFRNHEIVTFTIPGVGETCAETALFRDALEELQRLAAKGLRAEQTEKWLEEQIDLCERLDRLPHNDRYRRLLSYRDCLDRLKGVE